MKRRVWAVLLTMLMLAELLPAQALALEETALAGMAAASIAVESLETVSPGMSEPLLQRRMDEIKRAMRRL